MLTLTLADGGTLPVLTGIATYIQDHPYLFAGQLGGTVLIGALSLRLGRALQRWIITGMHEGKGSNGPGKLLGRAAYVSVVGFGIALITGLWGVESYQRALLEQLAEQAPILIRNVGLTLLVLALMLGVGRVTQRALLGSLRRRKLDISLSLLISRAIYLVVLVIGVLIMLAIWAVQLIVPVVALSGIALAISFSIQDIFKNLVAGVYLLIERPFHIGDQIVVDKYLGEVEDIQIRVTTLRTLTGEQVLIPNSMLFTSAVTNNSAYHRRRAMLTLTLPDSEMVAEEAEKAVLEALAAVAGVLADPPATIIASSVAEKKLTLAVHFWVPTDRLDVLSAALLQVKRVLPAAEVSVPGVVGMV